MFGTFLTYLNLNVAIASIFTGWILTNTSVKVGTVCNLNKNSRLRFSSAYCSDISFVGLLENTGVLTIPNVIYIFVLTNASVLFVLLLFKLNFKRFNRTIVFFESIAATSSFAALLLYIDTIKSQISFSDENSIIKHTGFKFATASCIISFVTLMLSLIRIKRKNQSELLWIN